MAAACGKQYNPQKLTRERMDPELGRSRGCIGRVRESAGAAVAADGRSRRPKAPPCKSPGRGRGYSKSWSVRNRVPGLARLDFLSGLRNCAIARLVFLSDLRNRAIFSSPPAAAMEKLSALMVFKNTGCLVGCT